jgi:glycosyltransferase involved in cell wall biosynthesis
MAVEIILSLCIPTYNRGSYLQRCLDSIVRQVGDNDEVEIIVSDNASDDNTKDIVTPYINNYRNVKYFRHETSIGGNENLMQVLKYGKGNYLKLLNDYLGFEEGCALKMLEIVKNHSESKEILFFANGLSYLKRKDFHYSKDMNEFLKIASYWSTWIGSFGIWKEDFWYIIENYTFKTHSFMQTELLFESVILKKEAVTFSKKIFISQEVVNKKPGYNFFDLFVNTYLNKIIVGLKDEKRITYGTYLKEKNRFFTNFIFMWYKKIKFKKNHSIDFDYKGMERVIFKTYKYNAVLYLYLLYLPFYLIGFYVKKIIRSFRSSN